MQADLIKITNSLSENLKHIRPSGYYITNPLEYAREPYISYLQKYSQAPKRAVFLGINPGPNGMAQTGIPFGDVKIVTSYLKISGEVTRPQGLHPKRPVNGFAHTKSEASGSRLWGYFSSIYPNAPDFFKLFFVLNYCPLMIFDAEGKNVTPDKLPIACRAPILAACDAALKQSIEVLSPKFCVGIGRFAQSRLQETAPNIKTVFIPHPSPANPAANKNWASLANAALINEGVLK